MDVYITGPLNSILVLSYWTAKGVLHSLWCQQCGSVWSSVFTYWLSLIPLALAGVSSWPFNHSLNAGSVINTLEKMSLSEHLNSTASAAQSRGSTGWGGQWYQALYRLYCTAILYYTKHCAIPHYTRPCTVLHCTVLYYTRPCTVLYYTVLYCIIPGPVL